ncbi:MAG TPA: glycosyltransferase family 2 protein [Caulobacteraceae bacterium]
MGAPIARPRHRPASPSGISCVVCAYNEEQRISHILEAVVGHPALCEIIVVNDGSTDATESLLRGYPSVRTISYAQNRGKTYAMGLGVAAASGAHIMLLDADLTGVTARDIDALAAPVTSGRADVSISLRRNSLWIYRLLGLDFVSGERVLPAPLLADAAQAMTSLPRWGAEAYLNDVVVRRRLRIAVVDWPGVFNIRKHRKVGLLRGALEELRMSADAMQVLSPFGVARQYASMLGLISLPARPAMARLPRLSELGRSPAA